MSGRCSGVQQCVKEVIPQAIYIHCFLKLVLVDCAKNVASASEFFALLESTYVFLSSIKAHAAFVRQQAKLHPDKPKKELQRLSDTLWACRYMAVDAICCTFDSLLATFDEISKVMIMGVEAKGLLLQVKSFSFLLLLIIYLIKFFLARRNFLIYSKINGVI